MKRTFTTTMPDRVGAFLTASRCIAAVGANITRVSYNKSIDMHMLFLQVDGTKQQLDQIEGELKALGYLPETAQVGSVMMLQFKLKDEPGTVEPVLEMIDRYRFNISYISSQENGGEYQYFKMGLLVEDEKQISRFVREVSQLCSVSVVQYDKSEKNLDNTVFYLNFANEIAQKAGLNDHERRRLLINANLIMQMLDERNNAPYKTFEYIGKFAQQLCAYHGNAFEARLSEFRGANGARISIAEPPVGCNLTVIEKNGEHLLADSGFACYRDEVLAVLRTLMPHFHSRERTAIITHADVDHCGLLDLFDNVYINAKCKQNFAWESENEPNYREQNDLHAPYVKISKLLSGYQPPKTAKLHVVGGTLAPCDEPLEQIGMFDFHGLHFEVWEGFGGHVAGEMIWIERSERIALTGDVFVNVKGFTQPQAAFNRLAPFLMTSVDTQPQKAAQERAMLKQILGAGEWLLIGAHGAPLRFQA